MMKLTTTLYNRLLEIQHSNDGRRGYLNHASIAKASTGKLRRAGYVRIEGERIASTGRLLDSGWAYITPEGRQALAAHKESIK